ncbi:MAG: alpha-D-xyloside xylohydrolase [Verrucomicrobiota bacterium]|jgi:alpha-D-xyloside xylohydrolase
MVTKFSPVKTLLLSLCAFASFATAAHAGLDANSTVFVIVMENHNWSSIKGSSDAPYINNTLLPLASYCDQYYNPPGLHPSEPNYLWLEAGSNFAITNDDPPASNHQSTTNHFVTQLKNAGISWKAYQESIDGLSCPVADNYPYAVRHNPFVFFDDVTNSVSPNCTSVVRPLTELFDPANPGNGDLANNTLAHYNFITPNVCSDMHDSCAPTNNAVKQGDDWLATYVPAILNSAAYQNNGLLIVTWDEGEGGSDGPIGCIVLSPLARGAGYHNAIRYTHSATLRTLQKIFGRTPLLGGAATAPDLSSLFVNGAIPNSDSPGVTTTSAANVSGGNATLGGTVNPNGDQTQAWFEYGLTNAYGTDTRSRSSDDMESYTSMAYGSNGGSGLGALTYREGSGGGVYLETGGAKIDGAKSFGMFAGGGSGNTQAADRQILNAKQAGTLNISVRWNVNNSTAFSGFNLKSAAGTTFGSNELISVGIRPANGNNAIAVNGGVQTIDLGSDIRGQVVDLVLNYDGLSGTYQLGAKFRASAGYLFTSGNLKAGNVTPAYLGFGNFNTGNVQDIIFDSISLVDSTSAGNGTGNVTATANITGLTPNTTYHYRAVGQNTRGLTYGADQTFGFPLVPPNNAAFHSFNSTSGNFQARIYDDTGHIAIGEPDLNGNPFANVITFAPPTAKIGGASYNLGKVLSVTNIANGIQLTQAMAGTTVTAQLTFTSDGVMHYEVTNWNGLSPTETDISAASDSTEHFYGFGEKFNSLDQAGNKVHVITSDMGGDKNDFSYKSSSWFVSSRGYGFHLDSSAESYFDMRNGAPDRYTVQNLFSTLKFNVVAGPKLTDVLTRYTGYTGRPYLPPPWVFGTWVSSDIWRTGGEVRYAITKHLQNGIPISVFVFDSPWEVSYNDFTWDMAQWGAGGSYEGTNYNGFSSVNDMMTFLQQNGVKVICWFTPFLNTSSFNDSVNGQNIPGQNTGKSPNYDFAAANNYFVRNSASGPPLVETWWKGTGSPIDFTNPAAVNWFKTTQLQPLVDGSKVTTANSSLEPAIGGFKTDDGEAIKGGGTYIPTTAVYSDGRTGLEMQNGYCVEYHKTVSSVLGANGILFARSGFNGTGAFPAGWPGDNQPNYTQTNGLQSVITAGDSAAMSGFTIWGHDIGGYQNANFTSNHADLFMRWAQYGAFTPIMQMHRGVQASSLTDTNNLEQYPWGYGAAALNNYVSYAKLHSQLFPYIYTYAKEASVDGLPIIRPLVLLNQTDAALVGVQHTYYFGNELLVAPMNAATSTSRNVQLPAGNWYDYWTNAKYVGGQNLAWSNADTTKIPLFVRESAIVPMLLHVPQTLCDANYVNNSNIAAMDNALQFLVYPGPSTASFTIYDGTTAQCAVAGTVTTLTLSSISRPVVFKVFADASPAGVERNGLRLPHLATQNTFDAASFGWFYDSGAKFLYAKFQHAGGGATVTFGPDSVGDGVTDSWRNYYGITDDTADSDGDGFTNAQEYFAGTNPNDPTSTFAAPSVVSQPDGFHVTWSSQLGIPYRVQWKNDLLDPQWMSIVPDFVGTGDPLSWIDDNTQTGPPPDSRRFYRVEVP